MVYQNKLLLEQNFQLKDSVTELKSDITFLRSENQVTKEIRLKKVKSKEKRQLALKQPLRDVISLILNTF